MNDHDAQRISAAMHAARPDWPASSLLTLIRKSLIDRPRRDVLVALAWVASEPNSHTPARVLEAGPWWRAAGVEGTAVIREQVDKANRCGICSESREQCARKWAGDHEFETPAEKAEPEVVADHVAALKATLEPTAGPTGHRTLDDLAEANPELHRRVEALREANPGVEGPPMQLTEPETIVVECLPGEVEAR